MMGFNIHTCTFSLVLVSLTKVEMKSSKASVNVNTNIKVYLSNSFRSEKDRWLELLNSNAH